MLRRTSDGRSAKHRCDFGRRKRPDPEDYAITLMLAAVVSAASSAATALIEMGRSAGWWH